MDNTLSIRSIWILTTPSIRSFSHRSKVLVRLAQISKAILSTMYLFKVTKKAFLILLLQWSPQAHLSSMFIALSISKTLRWLIKYTNLSRLSKRSFNTLSRIHTYCLRIKVAADVCKRKLMNSEKKEIISFVRRCLTLLFNRSTLVNWWTIPSQTICAKN